MKKLELTETQLKLLKGLLNKISNRDNGNKDYHTLYYEFTAKAPNVLENICKKLNKL
jgi:hypothetical protein